MTVTTEYEREQLGACFNDGLISGLANMWKVKTIWAFVLPVRVATSEYIMALKQLLVFLIGLATGIGVRIKSKQLLAKGVIRIWMLRTIRRVVTQGGEV